MLEIAAELSNVGHACKMMGHYRQQFHEIRRNFQTDGADGLIDWLNGRQAREAAQPVRRARASVPLYNDLDVELAPARNPTKERIVGIVGIVATELDGSFSRAEAVVLLGFTVDDDGLRHVTD